MTSLHDALIARMSEVLDEHTRRLPDSIAFVAPVRALAEAAVDVLSQGRGVPMLPRYDHELALQRRWHGVTEGLAFSSLSMRLDDETNRIEVVMTDPDGNFITVALPPHDGQEFGLWMLAAVEAAQTAGQAGVLDQASRDALEADRADNSS